jgi:hypothetical protein
MNGKKAKALRRLAKWKSATQKPSSLARTVNLPDIQYIHVQQMTSKPYIRGENDWQIELHDCTRKLYKKLKKAFVK